MPTNNNSKVCSSPWVSLAINADNSFSLCCNTLIEIQLGNWNEQSILQALNSDTLQEYRSKFKNNHYEKACQSCYSAEANNLTSKRDDFINSYKFEASQTSFEYKDIKRLEIFLNNTCNYSCRTCGSFLSSSWNKDSLKLGRDIYTHPSPSQRQIFELIEISRHLHSLYFAGGEPLLCMETYLVLEDLSRNNPECKITINTNLSTLKLKEYHLLNFIPQLHSLSLNISIDGVGNKGEYIRNGLSFNTFTNNLEKLAKENVKVTFLITVSILNIFDIEEIIRFIEFKQPITNFNVDINFVHQPEHYNIQIIPNHVKSILLASLYSSAIDFKSSAKLNKYARLLFSISSFLKIDNNKSSIEDFFLETEKIDSLRNQSFKYTFPDAYLLLSSKHTKRPV